MREHSNNAGHPWLIGLAAGVVLVFTVIASATWLPGLSAPRATMTIAAAVFALGILISTYWRFLRSWRFWIPLAGIMAFDAMCVSIFPEQVRNLTLWDIDLIAAFEFAAAGLFLSWFLDTKKARLERAHKKHL